MAVKRKERRDRRGRRAGEGRCEQNDLIDKLLEHTYHLTYVCVANEHVILRIRVPPHVTD